MKVMGDIHRTHLMYNSEVLLSGVVGVSIAGESTNDGVDDFPPTSSFVLPRRGLPARAVVSPWSILWSVVVSGPLRRVVSPLCGLILPGVPFHASSTMNEAMQVFSLDMFLNFILGCLVQTSLPTVDILGA